MSRASILLLEDDEKLRTMLQMVLEDEGYAVKAVPNGDDAIREAAGETYDLIVTDIRMEGTDGLDALAAVKEQRPEIGSVVITGYSTEADCIRAVRLGVNDYLRKPFRVEELLEAIEKALSRRHQQGQAEQAQLALLRTLLWGVEALGRAARESVTLLKNDGVLPLKAGVKKIAVLGANADDIRAQYGDWTYFTHPRPNPDIAPARPYVTLLEGVRALASSRGIDVSFARGCGPLPSEADDLAAAVAAAQEADVIVLALGDDIEQAGEFRDRADLSLSGRQEEFFLRLTELKKPIVTVLISTKPLCISREAEARSARR